MKKYLYTLLLLPTIIIFAIFIIWPLLQTIYLSFFDWNMIRPTRNFVGLANYVAVFTDSTTQRVFLNSLSYITLLLALNFVLPYILSFVMQVVIKRFHGIFKPVFFIPSIFSLVVGSMIYTWILNPIIGPVAYIMSAFGFDMPVWTRAQGWVIVVISLITTWKVFGYNFIVLLGGVAGVSTEVIEQARMDNIPLHKIFIDIVLPMSSSVGVYVFIMTIVQGMQFVFIPIHVLTQGGPNWHSSNVIHQAYHLGFVTFNTGRASALSVITMGLFVFLLWLQFRFVEKRAYYEN